MSLRLHDSFIILLTLTLIYIDIATLIRSPTDPRHIETQHNTQTTTTSTTDAAPVATPRLGSGAPIESYNVVDNTFSVNSSLNSGRQGGKDVDDRHAFVGAIDSYAHGVNSNGRVPEPDHAASSSDLAGAGKRPHRPAVDFLEFTNPTARSLSPPRADQSA